jgi:hypothetical protein
MLKQSKLNKEKYKNKRGGDYGLIDIAWSLYSEKVMLI